ncbi:MULTISPECIES: acyl-CoA dehydrogenase family protein [unclassified Streptomyces]|uniref:acyl-CoA dehydrogenase family protein n=1 Tax=unclassified Streptomyces TaxID=2593676 RepID=UPI002E289347|nr:acyl-CoA dehydrogenase family protein [Streptomyces sp. NBC_01429]
MRSLDHARELCQHYHPGLTKALESIPYAERESAGSPVIDLFREHGGPGLLVPREYGGLGADILDAIRVQRALGSLSPSLAAATAMHHFTAAMLYDLAGTAGRLTDAQMAILGGVAPRRLLMASGWAEGKTQQNILLPTVTATPSEDGYLLTGSKKPCSLARSMDLLTVSIAVPGPNGPELALALVPADAPGISVSPFWGNDVLAAAESDEVALENTPVPADLVIRTSSEDPHRLDDLQTAGFVCFTLLISAGYAGAASALVATVLERGRGSEGDRASLAIDSESAFAQLEGAARAVRDGLTGEAAVAEVLVARFAAQHVLVRTADRALDLLGGIDFIRGSDHSRLAASVRPLAFHPPGQSSAAEPLLSWFTGGPLELS